MTATSTARLLSLLSLLQTRRDWPGPLLAERLAVSPRTVRRDVDRLREMGYRIGATMGPDGAYRLDAGTELPPLLFDDDQVVALALALRSAPALGAGVDEASLRALTTVQQVMPSRLRHRVDALQFTTLPAHPSAPDAAPDVLLALSAAIRAHQTLRFDYASSSPDAAPEPTPDAAPAAAAHAAVPDLAPVAPTPPRRVEPHQLLTANARWYLLAWDLDREAWRTFRADRITPRTPTGPRFTPRPIPGGDPAAFVAARFKGTDPITNPRGWPCTGTVIIDRPAADILPFAADATVVSLDATRCTVTACSWSWVALAASLLRFDAPVEVLAPTALADAFILLSSRAEEAGTVAQR